MLISRVGPGQYDAEDTVAVVFTLEEGVSGVRRVTADATREDGRSPLNEAALLSLRHRGLEGKSLWVAHDEAGEITGFALADADPEAYARDAAGAAGTAGAVGPVGAGAAGSAGPVGAAAPVEVNLAVTPAARRAGAGRALAEAVLTAFANASLTAWSHGNHPGAGHLAAALGFDRVRDLWVMRRPLSPSHPLPPVEPAGGIDVRAFRPGQDEEAFLALNAEAFADHPEQGAMTRADLDERMAEPWFDPAGFFVAEDADAPHGEAAEMVESPSLLGFHWTKVHRDEDPPIGEVYVVGISPAAQGRGLGKLLTLTGLHHLRDQGLAEVILYVEADNAPAIAVYSGLGFTHADADTDVQYARG